MKFCIALIALTIIASANTHENITTIEKLNQSNDLRVVKGEPAKQGQFPWQVIVNHRKSNGYFLCGGSLISEQWVLTAAHCAEGVISFDLKLGGITKTGNENGRKDIQTTSYIVHPDYDSKNLNNDIALIKLPEPISFDSIIQSIKLPKKCNKIGANAKVIVSGIGNTGNAGSTVVRYAYLETVDNEKCAKVYGRKVVTNKTVCAVGNQGESSCSGDSGGPLVQMNSGEATLIGVVSFVHNKGCTLSQPAGFVRTEPYLDWIRDNTGIAVPNLIKPN